LYKIYKKIYMLYTLLLGQGTQLSRSMSTRDLMLTLEKETQVALKSM
jgi:hypothetical protein